MYFIVKAWWNVFSSYLWFNTEWQEIHKNSSQPAFLAPFPKVAARSRYPTTEVFDNNFEVIFSHSPLKIYTVDICQGLVKRILKSTFNMIHLSIHTCKIWATSDGSSTIVERPLFEKHISFGHNVNKSMQWTPMQTSPYIWKSEVCWGKHYLSYLC